MAHSGFFFLYSFLSFCCCCYFLFGPRPWHPEDPGPGMEPLSQQRHQPSAFRGSSSLLEEIMAAAVILPEAGPLQDADVQEELPRETLKQPPARNKAAQLAPQLTRASA